MENLEAFEKVERREPFLAVTGTVCVDPATRREMTAKSW